MHFTDQNSKNKSISNKIYLLVQKGRARGSANLNMHDQGLPHKNWGDVS